MKLQLVLSFLVGVAVAENCKRDGYWGPKCNKVCGGGCKKALGKLVATCDKATGACAETGGCEEKWTGDNCETPTCFGNAGCSYGGNCVAPDYCVCGKAGAQVVGKTATKGEIEGIDCVSLRREGIKGAGIALCVILFSITTCGLIAEKKGKPK